jgi:hypothetical protein
VEVPFQTPPRRLIHTQLNPCAAPYLLSYSSSHHTLIQAHTLRTSVIDQVATRTLSIQGESVSLAATKAALFEDLSTPFTSRFSHLVSTATTPTPGGVGASEALKRTSAQSHA